MNNISLSKCKKGVDLVVEEIHDNLLAQQLISLGLVEGEIIRIERIAPFGDPIIIKLNESFISMRKSDAERIEVRKNNGGLQ